MIHLPPDLIGELLTYSESGMGYQLGSLDNSEGLFVAGAYFIQPEPEDGEGLAGQSLRRPILLEAPTPVPYERDRSFGVLLPPSPIFLMNSEGQRVEPEDPLYPQLPPYQAVSADGDVFFRFSSFPDDRRILPDGSVAPRSYATSATDKQVVPNGLAAVGRYALPSRISARYCFRITPEPGTTIFYGTVTPNWGLAGGGVEVYFPDGTSVGTVTTCEAVPEK